MADRRKPAARSPSEGGRDLMRILAGRRVLARIPSVALLPFVLACGADPPSTLGVQDGTLAPCPPTPNCVHTAHPGEDGSPEPFVLELSAEEAWPLVREIVASMPRTRIVASSDEYLHAESVSRLFRFVDDLELLIRDENGRAVEIVVRSASRVGRSDLGVNGRRVAKLRALLKAGGVIR